MAPLHSANRSLNRQALMKKVEDASCRAQICRRQCDVLVEAFRTVSDHRCIQEMFQGIKLLGSCKMEGWIVRTLLRVESHWEFKEIHRFLAVHTPEVAREDREHLSQIAEQVSLRPDEEFAIAMAKLLLRESSLRFDKDGLPFGFLISSKHLPQRKPKFIANGSNGVVYGVRWLDHEFAIKRFRNFSHRQELLVLPMKHPNILSIVGYCYHEEEDSYSIVMERLATSLECLVKKRKKTWLGRSRRFKPFEEAVLVSIMLQIAQGMEFLHSHDLLHLDLKNSNIMVVDDQCKDAELHVKIGDFGSSVMLDELNLETEERNSKEGTPGYRAPDLRYSKKVDVFSYAMTCYELLCGERPFGGHDEAVRSSRDVRPELPLDDIGSLLARCWRHDPNDRPEFSEIINELHRIRSNLSSDQNESSSAHPGTLLMTSPVLSTVDESRGTLKFDIQPLNGSGSRQDTLAVNSDTQEDDEQAGG